MTRSFSTQRNNEHCATVYHAKYINLKSKLFLETGRKTLHLYSYYNEESCNTEVIRYKTETSVGKRESQSKTTCLVFWPARTNSILSDTIRRHVKRE